MMISLRFIIVLLSGLQLTALAFAAQPPGLLCNEDELKAKVTDPRHMQCLQRHIDIKKFLGAGQTALVTNTLPSFTKEYCPKLRNVISCVDDLFQDLEKCFSDPKQRSDLRSVKNLLQSVIDYVCYEDGKRILEFVANRGLQCLTQQQQNIQTCVKDKDGKNVFNVVTDESNNAAFEAIGNLSKGVPAQQCKILYGVTECFLNVLHTNCTSYSHDFFYNLILIVMQRPCPDPYANLEMLDPEHYFFAGLVAKNIPTKERKCAGEDSAWNVSKKAMVNATICWNKFIDDRRVRSDMKDAMGKMDFKSLLSGLCPKVRNVSHCAKDYIDSFQSCVDGDDRKTLDITSKMVIRVVGYLCENDGEKILDFLTGKEFQCLLNQNSDIKPCLKAAGLESSTSNNPMLEMAESAEEKSWAPERYNTEECRKLIALDECLVKSMNACGNPGENIHKFMIKVAEETPCNNLQLPTADGSSVILSSPFIIASLFLFVKFADF